MKKKIKESIDVFVPVTSLIYSKGNFDKLPAKKVYELVIDYPLTKPARYKINTGKNGMGLVALLNRIGKLYQKVYDREDATMKSESEGGCYGIWGHDIGDLSIEGINIDHKKKVITLDVGS